MSDKMARHVTGHVAGIEVGSERPMAGSCTWRGAPAFTTGSDTPQADGKFPGRAGVARPLRPILSDQRRRPAGRITLTPRSSHRPAVALSGSDRARGRRSWPTPRAPAERGRRWRPQWWALPAPPG